ncbi:hypothetical protein QVD17_19149 [Tagetes erecta]|uniref:Uncharacterized protein n=1 Tax=Tagetes erecta TaxID=13708 RepID=A0AAD8NPQ1_TARER|nr:hypothetical protein QVD17_19149 [Tagetes erecta]
MSLNERSSICTLNELREVVKIFRPCHGRIYSLHRVDHEFFLGCKSNLANGFITARGTTVVADDIANVGVMSLNSPLIVKGIQYDNMRLNGRLNFKDKKINQGDKHHGQ